MAQNTYRRSPDQAAPQPQKLVRLPAMLERFRFNLDLGEDAPVRYVPRFIFVTVLGILYIANTHYTDRVIARIVELEKQVEELRVEYSTIKYEYMYSSKPTEVARRVSRLGLEENDKPAIKIVVDK